MAQAATNGHFDEILLAMRNGIAARLALVLLAALIAGISALGQDNVREVQNPLSARSIRRS